MYAIVSCVQNICSEIKGICIFELIFQYFFKYQLELQNSPYGEPLFYFQSLAITI